MYYYGNPHLDPILNNDDLIQDAAKAALAAGSVIKGPWGKTPPPTAIQDTKTNIPPSIPTVVMQNLPKVLSRLGGIGAMLYPSELGHGMIQKGHIGSIVEGPDWPGLTQEMWDTETKIIQDRAQKKGLEGRRLYPYKRGSSPVSGRKFSYGPKSPKSKRKAPKRESAYQKERRKRKEEEQDAFQRMLMQYNRGMQNSISRPSIVPKPVWDAYVPDVGMSNYAVFDDIGRFEGLDMDAMLASMGVGPPPGYSKRKV